jgi:chemosensory pili system protein ChpA (sensor histidine kinase/response regulator)
LLVDRTIYDVATTALGHLLRNAIVHGIETPEARRAAGKDEVGRLVIEARQESYETVLTVRDDGGGIDHDRVRRKAESLGWVTSDVPLTEADVFGFIFRPGFSTAEELDETAGRGVGLDAVWSAVVAVRGRVTVESTSGIGACFTLRLPLAMTVAEVLWSIVAASGWRCRCSGSRAPIGCGRMSFGQDRPGPKHW